MNKYYVYEYLRLDTNEVFYVGKGTGDRYKDLYGRNKHFKSIVKTTQHTVTILLNELTEEEAFEAEKFFIYYYKMQGQAYCNFTNGGEGAGGLKHTNETKKKMSDAHKGQKNPWKGKKLPIETINKMSVSRRGKKRSDETKKKMSDARKGIIFSDQHRKRISEAQLGINNNNFGRTFSEETKKKMSDAKKGSNHPSFGKTISDETKKKMSDARKGMKHSEESRIKMSEAKKKRDAEKRKIIIDNPSEI